MATVAWLVIAIWQGQLLVQTSNSTSAVTLHPLLRDAPAQWASYRQAYLQHVTGYRMRNVIVDQQGSEFHLEHGRYRRRGDLWLWEWAVNRQRNNPDFFDRVYGRNSLYGFNIGRPSPGQPYLLAEVGLLPNGLPRFLVEQAERQERQRTEDPEGSDHLALLVHRFLSRRWPAVVKSPDTSLRKVERDPARPELIRVEVEYNDRPRIPVSAAVAFDTTQFWLPVSSRVTWLGETLHITSHLKKSTFGIPLLIRRDTEVIGNRAQKGVEEYSYELTTDPWSEADFTLSAYGLPEPYGVEWPKPTPWWLYIGAGTLATVLLLGLVWRFRKWRAASA